MECAKPLICTSITGQLQLRAEPVDAEDSQSWRKSVMAQITDWMSNMIAPLPPPKRIFRLNVRERKVTV